MNQKKSFSVLLIVLLVVLAGAMFAYRYLSDKVTPDTDGSLLDRVTETADTVKTGIESSDVGDASQSDVFPAMDFTVYDIDRNPVKLSDFFGKPILINFWATWCPPCREEFKRVQKDIIDHFKGQDFVFLPISRGEKKVTVDQFRDKQGYTFPMGLDPTQEIYKKYASNYIPRNFVVGKDGKIIYVSVGYEASEFEAMIKAIEAALK